MDRQMIARGAALGLQPHYFCEDAVAHAPSIAQLFASAPNLVRTIDAIGLRQFLDRRPDGRRTCFAGVGKVPQDQELWRAGGIAELRASAAMKPPVEPLLELLDDALDRILARRGRVALALSGGLDSALLLAMLRRRGKDLAIFTLATSLPSYCEREVTLAAARQLGAREVCVFEASAADFIAALPAAIAACETPLFNLHPVSKWLLLGEVRRRGFDTVVTGDGADQVFAGSDPRNYLPIVGAMARAAGVALASPFLDERVIASARTHGVDANKSALRSAAANLLPREIAHRPKTPRLMPDLDLSRFRNPAADAELARLLGIAPPPCVPGPELTLWATGTLLFQQLGGLN
jgi:asparagine synthase (glutamine-hydrolysing)